MQSNLFSNDFSDAIANLFASRSAEEYLNVTSRLLEKCGYWSFNYACLDFRDEAEDDANIDFLFSSMSPAWLEHYGKEGFDAVDPCVERVRSRILEPVHFGPEKMLHEKGDDNFVNSFCSDAKSAGLYNMVCLPLNASSEGLEIYAGIGLVSDLEQTEFSKLWQKNAKDLLVFSNVLNECMKPDIARHADGVSPLTPREEDCLSRLAVGKRPDQISDDLFISTVTVNYHIRQVRQKLSAQTNAEAVAKAIRYGQLN